MKRILTGLILSILFTSIAVYSQKIPESDKSRTAIARVKRRLKKEMQKVNLNWGAPIFIRIFKEPMQLEMWVKNSKQFQLFKTYKICTYGGMGIGPKIKKGDGKAPEGFYYVTPNRLNPNSKFHLSFNIGYPNKYDRFHNRTGAALMVHGNCVSIGCFAMTDTSIEEIYALADAALRNGQNFFRVHIFPFRMTGQNIEKHRDSKWFDFWENLKQGYDLFEQTHIPPNVNVKNGRYVFGQ